MGLVLMLQFDVGDDAELDGKIVKITGVQFNKNADLKLAVQYTVNAPDLPVGDAEWISESRLRKKETTTIDANRYTL